MGRFDETRQALTVIGRTNGVLSKNEHFTKLFKEEVEKESQSAEKASLKEFVKISTNVKNGFIFLFMAINCSFVYYLINFYAKYLPGDIYLNQIVNSLAESVGNGSAAYLASKLPIRLSFAACFIGSGFACALVIFAEIHQVEWLVPVGVLLAKLGISSAFSILYFATVHYFDTAYLGLMMGLTNLFGRFSTMFAPMVAE